MELGGRKKMKVARLAGPRKLFAIVDCDRPKPSSGEVVVKVVASGSVTAIFTLREASLNR